MSVSAIRALVYVGDPLEAVPATDAQLVIDALWSPRVGAAVTIPYTADRADALDPRTPGNRLVLEVVRSWQGALTLADLTDGCAGLTLADLTTRWAGVYLVRTNLAHSPRATVFNTTPGRLGYTNTRWFGQAPAAGTYTLVTGATDGPLLPDGSRITTYARKTWTVASASLAASGDTGFSHTNSAQNSYVVTPGQVLTFSSWLRPSRQRVVQANIMPYNGTVAGVRVQSANTVAPAGAWTRVSITYTVPASGVTTVQVNSDVTTSGSGGTTGGWQVGDTLDGTGLLAEPEPGPAGGFFDGATPDAGAVDYAWTGVPNLSPSTATTTVTPATLLGDLTVQWGVNWGNGWRADDVVQADVAVRARTIDHGAATIAVRGGSDELLAQDAHAGDQTLPTTNVAERILALLEAGAVPVVASELSAAMSYTAPTLVLDWSRSIWSELEAVCAANRLRVWCDEQRTWRVRDLEAGPVGALNVPRASAGVDDVNRDGQYADVIVWVGTGISDDGAALRETRVYPDPVPEGPNRVHVETRDYGQVGAGLPMPGYDELAARLARLQSADRILTVTTVADPTVRPGLALTTGAPSLPAAAGTLARVEWRVPDDVMVLTTRDTVEV